MGTETTSPLAKPVPQGLALGLASAAWTVPALMSGSTAPSPNHPRVLLWYKTLRQPPWKPPDIAIPLAWMGIETCLAAAAYRLLRRPGSPARDVSLGWLATNVIGIGCWNWLFFGKRNSRPAQSQPPDCSGPAWPTSPLHKRKIRRRQLKASPWLLGWPWRRYSPHRSGAEIDKDARRQPTAKPHCPPSCVVEPVVAESMRGSAQTPPRMSCRIGHANATCFG